MKIGRIDNRVPLRTSWPCGCRSYTPGWGGTTQIAGCGTRECVRVPALSRESIARAREAVREAARRGEV